MSDECIHGLEDQLCASCFPKAAPAVATTAPRVVRAPASKAREAASPTTLRTAVVAKSPAAASLKPTAVKSPAAPVGEQRIYHVTHINNLAQVLSSGCLLADASDAWDQRPAIDISAAPTREARREALVAGEGSSAAANYVPFFLSPDSEVWNSIRSQDADPRLSKDAYDADAYDFVILVSTVGRARDHAGEDAAARIAVSDGDASAASTRFATTPEASERMLQRLRADQDSTAILAAEFLVADQFPFELVSLIGVANDKVRVAVKGILAASDFRPKVAVYPPWFQPAEQPAP
ncbi:MAG TPA: DarT ssDNA thymidine ADP-ribosyltransferase family protein [Glaciibacter sp.]|nr:DarT ssDNA thymidine ADP-ribosyltransferase family protein [Glaciibacter sp.]